MSRKNGRRYRNEQKQQRQSRESTATKTGIESPHIIADTDEAIRIYYPSGTGMLMPGGAKISVWQFLFGQTLQFVVSLEPKASDRDMVHIDPRCVVVLDDGDGNDVPLYDPRLFRDYMGPEFTKTLDEGWPERVLGSNRPPARRCYREGVGSPPPGCLWI